MALKIISTMQCQTHEVIFENKQTKTPTTTKTKTKQTNKKHQIEICPWKNDRKRVKDK